MSDPLKVQRILGLKLRSAGRAEGTLKHGAISPASGPLYSIERVSHSWMPMYHKLVGLTGIPVFYIAFHTDRPYSTNSSRADVKDASFGSREEHCSFKEASLETLTTGLVAGSRAPPCPLEMLLR